MNKALFGLALLSYNWEIHKKDIIDSYIPLICEILQNKGYTTISRDIIKTDIEDAFGITIPILAIEGILKRMTKEDIIKNERGSYYVNHTNVGKWVNNKHKTEIDSSFADITENIIQYSKTEFDISFEKTDVEDGLINFLKENDLEILFASSDGTSILPKVPESKKMKYIIAKFVFYIQDKDKNKFNNLVRLAKGYSIASLITYKDLQNYSGKLDKVEIFFDAPIFFNLLGLNGDSNLKSTLELVEILKNNGAKLRVFEINYGEVVKTIQDAIDRLRSGKYDILKSSRVLRTAVRENISSSNLQIKLNQLENVIEVNKIDKVQSPNLNSSEHKYQISEEKLTESIKQLYSSSSHGKISWWKIDGIDRDVTAISNIFKIRQNNLANSLKNSKAILLTTNESIAFASKKYESTDWNWKSVIPPCMTDVFLSTILWANYSVKNDNLKIKQLISSCYSITELDNKLLNKYIGDVKRMHSESKISDEQFYLLSSSNLTYNMLEKKTLNDFDDYTDKTPSEILEDLEIKIRQETEYERDRISKIELQLARYSKILAKIITYLILILIIGLSLFLRYLNPKIDGEKTKIIDVVSYTLAGLLSIFGFLRWKDIIPPLPKIEERMENWFLNNLRKIISLK